MPNIRLKWPQIIAIVSPKIVEYINPDVLLAMGRSSSFPLRDIGKTVDISGSGNSILSRTNNISNNDSDI